MADKSEVVWGRRVTELWPMGFFETEEDGVLGEMAKALRDREEALLKKITVANYRQDPYYAPIVRAVEGLLREKGFVAPVELFIRMNLLSPESAEDWRRGQISYLERVIGCNLSKASRILRILRMHAHDLDLKPSLTVYKRWTKGSRPLLRFSKTGDHNVEEAYARHFVSPRKKGCPFEAGFCGDLASMGSQHATRNSGRPSPEVVQAGASDACPCKGREKSCNVAASMRV